MKCHFCKEELEKGTGKVYVKNDGKLFYFCSSKCEKNSKIRDPKFVGWVRKNKKTDKKK
jgi:large subunit ribosomal protein L24e